MAGKIKVHHHAGNLIVLDENRKRLFSNIYGYTYPVVEFRGSVNLLGGNQNKEDYSPKSLIEREIMEEFSGETEEQKNIESSYHKVLGEGPGGSKNNKLGFEGRY